MAYLMNVIKNIRFMFGYSWRYAKSRYFIAMINIMLNTIQPLITLLMPKYIIDELTYDRRWKVVLMYIGLLVGINLLIFLIRSIVGYVSDTSRFKCSWEFGKYYGVICASMDYNTIENSSMRDKINQAINNTNPINFVDGTVVRFFTTVFQLIGYTYIIFTLNPIIIIFILLIIFISSLITKRRQKISYEYEPIFSKFSRKFNYLLNAMIRFDFGKEVRINKASTWLENKFSDEIDDYMKNFHKNLNGYLVLSIFDTIVGFFQTIAMYGYAAYKIMINSITVGSFSVYLGAITAFAGGIREIINSIISLDHLSKYVDDYKEINSYLTTDCKKDEVDIDIRNTHSHEIVFENVSFKYPNTDNYVLKNISIKIEAGKKLSIVGYNGAGKTTFIKLICRFYEPTEGRILYNGIDISTINKTQYMKLLSVVFQDYALIYFTIKDNIVFESEYSTDVLNNAIVKSGLQTKIDGLTMGLDTPLTKEFDDRGIEFSGGEGQKLACARAYYKNAPIIIFDEPTASLDPMAESALYERFNNIIENKTAVYISHRLASVRFCDNVAVFVNGEIVEYGTHEELINQNGVYAEMFNKQSQFYIKGETNED